MRFTLSKWGLGSPPRLPKLQSSILGVKTPCIGEFFISLESYRRLDVENGLAWVIWTSIAQVLAKKKGRESNYQFDSWPLKVGNWPDPDVLRESATHRWKALDESYNFALDLVPIEGLNKKLWSCKVVGIQTVAVSKLLLGSLGTKSHLDVSVVRKHREYYMGEGGGFPQVRAVVSLVSPELPVACPSTKGAPKCELTNLLVGLMQVRVSN
jgi:hypothetical protein